MNDGLFMVSCNEVSVFRNISCFRWNVSSRQNECPSSSFLTYIVPIFSGTRDLSSIINRLGVKCSPARNRTLIGIISTSQLLTLRSIIIIIIIVIPMAWRNLNVYNIHIQVSSCRWLLLSQSQSVQLFWIFTPPPPPPQNNKMEDGQRIARWSVQPYYECC